MRKEIKVLKRMPQVARLLENKGLHRIVLVYKDKEPVLLDVAHKELLKRLVKLIAERKKCCIFADAELIALGENFFEVEALVKKEDLIAEGIQFSIM